jgi:hypothetical protein
MMVVAWHVQAEVFPVMVGGDENFDACSSLGTVTLPTKLHSAPNNNSKVYLIVETGTRFMMCDSAEGGWRGIVFGEESPYCGLTSPIAVRQPYSGECNSGWIENKSIELLAG